MWKIIKANKKTRFLFAFFIILVFCMFFIQPQKTLGLSNKNNSITSINIFIQNDADFLAHGLPGEGTQNKPYLIQFRTIYAQYLTGIFIYNTTAFFKIENCQFYSSRGIIIVDTLRETWSISNCSFYTSSYPIIVRNCDSLSIYNCLFTNTPPPLLEDLNNISFSNNVLIGGSALMLHNISRGIIYKNSFEDLTSGCSLDGDCNNLCLYNNTFLSNRGPGLILDGLDNIVYHNNFTNNEITSTGSQADDKSYTGANYWYEPTLKSGNWWSDYLPNPEGYRIKPGGPWDKYPIGKFVNTTTIPTTPTRDTELSSFPMIASFLLCFALAGYYVKRKNN
ncbi:MAG: right-handed parallel beta-helix repeat-containing protein [Candidatus Heimdallarchaeota archaeon]|nr:right-handed parallel beta-helix repeat-containing protein [Candidatus Heimdallarchaeota archaeon]